MVSISKSIRSFIVNGFPSPATRLFYAKLKFDEGFCGASIVNSQFVVTAAHCVFYANRKYFKRLRERGRNVRDRRKP